MDRDALRKPGTVRIPNRDADLDPTGEQVVDQQATDVSGRTGDEHSRHVRVTIASFPKGAGKFNIL